MHRFFAAGAAEVGQRVQLSEAESSHAARVLRLNPGATVEITDPDSGCRFLAELTDVSPACVTAQLTEEIAANEPPVRVTLYMGIPKADKLDFVVQKATELGAVRVVPVRMERSVAKIDRKDAPKKAERMRKIAAEAVKQCGRARTPDIAEAMDFTPAMQQFAQADVAMMPWEDARGTRMRDVYAEKPDARTIAIWIGPEGGISANEADRLINAGATAVTLGPRILRTETAAVASITVALQLWGDI